MLIKSSTDIQHMVENGRLMGAILDELAAACKPGVSTWHIDKLAEKLIVKAGGRPAFKGYRTHVADRPFPSTICASLNDELVHGIPKKYALLKEGDIFSIDIGMEYPWKETKNKKQETKNKRSDDGTASVGVISDTAITVAVGAIPAKTQKLLDVTKQALEEGIKMAQPGNSIASIGRAIESYVKSQGKFGVVRDLVGHGVGHAVHEEPYIPNYYDKALEKSILAPGMIIAIEPMMSLGGWQVETMDDGWTIRMRDRSLSAHFEHTVIITETGNIVATRRPNEK